MIEDLTYHKPVVEVRRLAKDVPNPKPDRRKKRSLLGLSVIPKGTNIKLYRQDLEVKDHPETRKTVTSEFQLGWDKVPENIVKPSRSNQYKDDWIANPLFTALMEASEPIENAYTVFAEERMESMRASDFAKLLVKRGTLTLDGIREILRSYLDKPEEED